MSWKTIEIRFRERYELRCREICETPEVREALDALRRGALGAWRKNEPLELVTPPSPRAWFAEPFWHEIAICRNHGLDVQVEDRGCDPPALSISLTLQAGEEDLAARIKYPQDLLRPADYDLWEIRREGPLSRILQELEYQWRQLHDERTRMRQGTLFSEERIPAPLPGRRTASPMRSLWAIEAYRRRLKGGIWRTIAQEMKRHSSTLRRAVRDLCERTGLPWPERNTILPDAPEADCDRCEKRRSPSEPCAECPWIAFTDRLACSELPGVQRVPRG